MFFNFATSPGNQFVYIIHNYVAGKKSGIICAAIYDTSGVKFSLSLILIEQLVILRLATRIRLLDSV